MAVAYPRPWTRFLVLGIAVVQFNGCAQNPVTGKRDFVLMSPEEESELGAEAALMVEAQIGTIDAGALSTYVADLGRRLAAHSPRQDVSYSFAIVDMEEPNAFALPGGYIYVSRGLLAITNSEDELANVIAHEIGHVAALHHARQQARTAGFGLLTSPVRLVGGLVGGTIGALIEAPFAVAGYSFIAAHGRGQEREADHIAQDIAAQVGYDPTALSTFLSTLQRDTDLRMGGDVPRRVHFFDTHPSTPERVKTAMERGMKLPWTRGSTLVSGRNGFLDLLAGLLLGLNPAEGVFDDQLFRHPDMDFAMSFPDGWETVNTRMAVAAQVSDGRANITLVLDPSADAPKACADSFFAEVAKEVNIEVAETQSLEVGGLPAYRAVAAMRATSGTLYLDLTWIRHNDLVFRIVGAAPARSFDTYRVAFANAAMSFRRLDRVERESIQETRLRVAKARASENLEALSSRTKNAWSVEETAVVNALEVDAVLSGTESIKVAVPQTYEKKPATADS